MDAFDRTLDNTIPIDRNGHPVSVLAGYNPTAKSAIPLGYVELSDNTYALKTASSARVDSAAMLTPVTVVSAAAPAITTVGTDTLTLALNGEDAQTITFGINANGAAVAADLQAKVRALTAADADLQAAYDDFTCTYVGTTYTLTSGLAGAGSSVVVSSSGKAAALRLGDAVGGVETAGTATPLTAGTSVSNTSAATLIMRASTTRSGHMLINTGSKTVYMGVAGSVTTSTGIPVGAGASFGLDLTNAIYAGDIYGITNGADTTEIRGITY